VKTLFERYRRLILVALPAGLRCLFVLDVVTRGPYACYYNWHHQELANNFRLVGKEEIDVVKCLGRPSATTEDNTTNEKIYDYYPHLVLPCSKFQVFCRDGKLVGTEQFDDQSGP
jgi:hypothetical protein